MIRHDKVDHHQFSCDLQYIRLMKYPDMIWRLFRLFVRLRPCMLHGDVFIIAWRLDDENLLSDMIFMIHHAEILQASWNKCHVINRVHSIFSDDFQYLISSSQWSMTKIDTARPDDVTERLITFVVGSRSRATWTNMASSGSSKTLSFACTGRWCTSNSNEWNAPLTLARPTN